MLSLALSHGWLIMIWCLQRMVEVSSSVRSHAVGDLLRDVQSPTKGQAQNERHTDGQSNMQSSCEPARKQIDQGSAHNEQSPRETCSQGASHRAQPRSGEWHKKSSVETLRLIPSLLARTSSSRQSQPTRVGSFKERPAPPPHWRHHPHQISHIPHHQL